MAKYTIFSNIISGSSASITSITGSLQGTASWANNAITSSYANNLTVAGTLTAQTIVAQTITSSTDFVTGSTRFGSLLANTHQFTGSVSITGSLAVNGSSVVLGTGSAGQVAYWNGTSSQAGSSNFIWDNTNSRLGIGTNTPTFSISAVVNLNTTSGYEIINNSTGVFANAGIIVRNSVSSGQLFKLGSGYTTYKTLISNDLGFYNVTSGDISFLNDVATGKIKWAAGASSTAQMTLTAAGRLLLGTTTEDTSALLNVTSTTQGFLQPRMTTTQRDAIATPATGLQVYNTTTNTNDYYNGTAWVAQQTSITNPVTGTGTTNYIPKWTSSSAIGNSNLINDASGNIGLGVVPSAWGSNWKALELSNGVYLTALSSSTVPIMILGANAYFDNTNFIYKNTAAASRYQQDSGVHYWYTAPSGTAGNAISFTQAMTLTSGGNLLVGTTTDSGEMLQVSGTGRFSGTLTVVGNAIIGPEMYRPTTDSYLRINGGGSGIDGATILMFGSTHPTAAGRLNLNSVGSESIIFSAGGATRLTIASTGAATFSSSVTATSLITDVVRNTSGDAMISYLSNVFAVGSGNVAQEVKINAGGSERARFTSGGNLLIGTMVDSGERLQVTGNVKVSNSGTSTIRVKGNSTTGTDFQNDSGGGYIWNRDATPLYFATNGIQRFVLDGSTGAATFSSSVTATSGILQNSSVLSTVMGTPQLRLINNAASTINQRVDLGLRFEDGTYNGIGGISMVRESATARGGTIILQPIASDGNPLAALSIASTGAATFSSSVTATSFIKSGGTSSQYLMADGSVSTGGGGGSVDELQVALLSQVYG